MKVFIKITESELYHNEVKFVKGWNADGSLDYTDKLEEALNLNIHYYSFEDIPAKVEFIKRWAGGGGAKITCVTQEQFIKVGNAYLKDIDFSDERTECILTNDFTDATSIYHIDLMYYNLWRKPFKNLKLDFDIVDGYKEISIEEMLERI